MGIKQPKHHRHTTVWRITIACITLETIR